MKRFKDTAASIKLDKAIDQLKNLKDGTVVPVPIELLSRGENIRSAPIDDNDPELDALIASIKEVGLLQFPVITVSGAKIACVAGHRRLKACEALKMERVSCVVKKFETLNDKEMAQLLENTARRAVHPLDIGRQLLKLRERGFSQVKLEKLLGKDRKTIGRFQKIATWPRDAQRIVENNPDTLRTGLLLKLASRDLSRSELIKELKIATGKLKPAAPEGPSKQQLAMYDKTKSYLSEKGMGKREQNTFIKMLVEIGYLKKEVVAKGA